MYWIVSSVEKKWKPGRGSGFEFVTVKKSRPVQDREELRTNQIDELCAPSRTGISLFGSVSVCDDILNSSFE